jgi:N-acetylglutamate synthase-like GNAT family acetyltransferase
MDYMNSFYFCPMNFRIIEPKTKEELEKYYNLRFEILRKPWNQPVKSTKDEWEDKSIHFLMLDENNNAVACGRLQLNSKEEGQIRSMAVRDDMQGKGIGKQIIDYIEKKAGELKLKTIDLDARMNAVKFYERCGYKVIADSYLLFGVIQHYKMEKHLDSNS